MYTTHARGRPIEAARGPHVLFPSPPPKNSTTYRHSYRIPTHTPQRTTYKNTIYYRLCTTRSRKRSLKYQSCFFLAHTHTHRYTHTHTHVYIIHSRRIECGRGIPTHTHTHICIGTPRSSLCDSRVRARPHTANFSTSLPSSVPSLLYSPIFPR